jgi:hypothetical protein
METRIIIKSKGGPKLVEVLLRKVRELGGEDR